MHRLYENNEIIIFWNSDKCAHAGECVRNSPHVFNPSARPWVKLYDAESLEVRETVKKCPPGALSIAEKYGIEVIMEPESHRSAAYDRDKLIGKCEYLDNGSEWCIVHTGVRSEYEGKGIAKRLVYTVLQVAERNKVKVTATCSYACKVLNE